MSNRLAGVSPLNYQGTQASNPPNITYHRRAPIPTDWQNFSIGDFWIYSVQTPTIIREIWVLLSLAGNVADWVQLGTASGGTVTALHTQDGNNVTPTAGIINIYGTSPIETTGTNGPNTVTIGLTTVPVINGGTGDNSFIPYAPICAGTTSTGALQQALDNFGDSGYVLTSSGASALPTWQPSGSAGTAVSFNAYLSTTQTDATGDGTVYQPIFDAVLFNNDSGYDASTGVFTAPVTGDYLFQAAVAPAVYGLTNNFFLVTTSNTFAFPFNQASSGNGVSIWAGSVIVSMSAGDTAYITLTITLSSPAKTVNLNGGSSPILTYFCGALLASTGGGGGSLTIDTPDNSSSVTGTTLTLTALNSANNSGSSVTISGSGTTMALNVTDANHNTLVGLDAGNSSVSGIGNVALGWQALKLLSSGHGNTAVGSLALENVTTGVVNIAIGTSAGADYTGAESSNIVIGNFGTVGESNVLRIGTQGSGSAEQNQAYIAGIYGNSPASPQYVIVNSSGQLGTTTTFNGLSLIQTQTVPNGTSSVAFTTGITSTYTNYLLRYNNFVGISLTSNQILLQISTNGGTSYITTGYTLGSSSTATTGLVIGQESVTQDDNWGEVELANFTNGTAYVGCFAEDNIITSGVSQSTFSSYYNTPSTTVNAFKIVTQDGSTFMGTFSLYGYTK